MDLFRCPVKAELCHFLGKRRGQRGLGFILRCGGNGTCLNGLQALQQRGCALCAYTVKQFAAGFLGGDIHRRNHQNIAGIHAFIQLHNGYAGAGIAVEHRPLNGGRAAILGQKRNMKVDAAVFGHRQNFGRDQAAIGHHHHDLGRKLTHDLCGRAVAQGFGLPHGNAVLHGQLLYGRCR